MKDNEPIHVDSKEWLWKWCTEVLSIKDEVYYGDFGGGNKEEWDVEKQQLYGECFKVQTGVWGSGIYFLSWS